MSRKIDLELLYKAIPTKFNGEITAPELAKRTGYSQPTIWKHLSDFVNEGKVIRIKQTTRSVADRYYRV